MRFSSAALNETSLYVTSLTFNGDSNHSPRADKLMAGTKQRAARKKLQFSTELESPVCSFEVQIRGRDILVGDSALDADKAGKVTFGSALMMLPFVSKSNVWQCFFRSAYSDQYARTAGLFTTLFYCPSPKSDMKACPAVQKALDKEKGRLKTTMLFQGFSDPVFDSKESIVSIGPVTLALASPQGKRYKGQKPGTEDLMKEAKAAVKAAEKAGKKFERDKMGKIPGIQNKMQNLKPIPVSYYKTLTNVPVELARQITIAAPAIQQSKALGGPAVALAVTPDAVNPTAQCQAEWTTEEIVGRCFGLKTHNTYAQFSKYPPEVASREECKKMCCQLGRECVTWQYWVGIKMCKLGERVRIGYEHAPTPYWCDINPPIKWTGRRIERAKPETPGGKAAITKVSPEELTTQCFGLGAERMKPSTDDGGKGSRMSESDCKTACETSASCFIWQYHPERGCFYGSNGDAYCESYTGAYTGGRKKYPVLS